MDLDWNQVLKNISQEVNDQMARKFVRMVYHQLIDE
jgi:hypothetical protein